MTTFKNYKFKEEIFTTLSRLNFVNPTEIQAKIIPLALKGKSIIGKSPTGSGKTHAYLLPILNQINTSINQVQALIMLPTRELATQIFNNLSQFQEDIPQLRLRLITGGLDRVRMIEKVSTVPHIVIGTPGRIKDIALTKAKLNIVSAKILILDEADMIMEAGFLDDVAIIAGNMKDDLQMMVFSATIPAPLKQFLNKYMDKPELIETTRKEVNPGTIRHIAVPDHHRDKAEVIIKMLEGINPYLCLIFVSKKSDITALYDAIREKNYNVGMIHGDLPPGVRRNMMKRIHNNEFTYIVASDIASRGIDIEGVSHIINYDLPRELEYFFHRAGRTGRNGHNGVCYTLYHKEDMPVLQKIMETNIKFDHEEYKDGEWVVLKPLVHTFKKKKEVSELDQKIKKVVNINKGQKVKPGYKKKVKAEIEQIKRKHRREVIKKDIKRQIRERAIIKTKQEKIGG